ncbi:MAG: LacI family DNA-binding transcriptional regulator [Anaerolineae bacterium]|nr:LacI family DNA-binding transcriptional regulator [Anaerolineae bacterium]
MESKPPSSTISDVARMAGVSIATVSRVIHNNGVVSEETRLRVREAVEHLGYQSRRTPKKLPAEKIVLLLSGDVVNPFFAEIIRGTQEEIDLQKNVLNIIQISTDHKQLIRTISRLPASGVILTGTYPFSELLEWREEAGIPLVVINHRINQPGVSCIAVDFRDAYIRATRHLIDLGHTRIGYVDVNGGSEICQARLQGYLDALDESGIPFRQPLYTSLPAETHVYGGFQAAGNLLTLPPDEQPTAVITFNDLFALGVMHAARAHGLRVPEDVSVVGCDDIPMATYAYPPLTTIGQPKYRIGKLAVSTLLQMCQDASDQAGSYTLMESPLIIRESTGRCHQS